MSNIEANRQTHSNIRIDPFVQIPCEVLSSSPGNGGGERVPMHGPLQTSKLHSAPLRLC